MRHFKFFTKSHTNPSMPRYSWILFPKSENLDTNTRVEGSWVSAIRDLVFKNIWKINRLNSRFKMDSQPEFFDFNIRLKGYSIWSATIRRTPYMKIILKDFKTTLARASRSLGTAREVLGRHVLREVRKLLGDGFRSTRRLATTWLWRPRGFVITEAMGYLTCRGPVRDMGYPMPTQVVENKCRTDLGLWLCVVTCEWAKTTPSMPCDLFFL
jgi:hypothetical protein